MIQNCKILLLRIENNGDSLCGQHGWPSWPLHGLQPCQPFRDRLPPHRRNGQVVEKPSEELSTKQRSVINEFNFYFETGT